MMDVIISKLVAVGHAVHGMYEFFVHTNYNATLRILRTNCNQSSLVSVVFRFT
jgi:hypothetical protein